MKYVLYIAEHNITKLKYFGKTERYFTQEELQKNYHGSGVYWKKHLKKHGDNVTMSIYGIYDDYETAKQAAILFSIENDIVFSEEWANLSPELLSGGSSSGERNGMYGKNHTPEVKQKLREKQKGKIVVRDLICNEVFTTTIEEYKNNDNLVAASKGRKILETSKHSETHKGSKNPRACRINIYNECGQLMFECYGNFNQICKENELPTGQLGACHREEQPYVYYEDPNNKFKYRKIPEKYKKFIGWTAKKIKDKQ